MNKKALLLGAGGPLGGLEAGALIALDEKGVKFDVISGACIGSIIGLAYKSPAGNMTGAEALEKWCNSTGLSDFIYYSFSESNYKVFQQNAGPFNGLNNEYLKLFTSFNPFYSENPENEIERFTSDLYLYWLSLFSIPFSWPDKNSISRIAPFLDNFIDFEDLKNADGEIYINALNITDKKIETFGKKEITKDHAIAGSSLLFVCPQTEIDGKVYGEGSYVDCLNYKALLENEPEIKTLVVMNIMDSKTLIRQPRNLYDAYNLSVMLPFLTIAEDDTKLFEAKHLKDRELLKVSFNIPEDHIEKAMDWSCDNFKRLRDIGYEGGLEFYKKNKAKLEG